MRSRSSAGARRVAVMTGAALVLAFGAAAAGPRRLAVLELSDGAGLEPGAVQFLGERVRGEAARLPRDGWLVMTRENLLALLPPDTDLADCQGECEVETGRNIGADVVVSGAITRLGGELKVTLRAHETRDGALLGQQVAAAPEVAALDEPVAAAARALFLRLSEPAGPRGRATLRLRVPDGLDVRINGVPVGTTPLPDQPLDAGRHRVEVESRCHRPVPVQVELVPGEDRTLALAPPPRLARLRVDAISESGEGVPARVVVDGRPLGDAPGAFDVPVCAERLEVVGPDTTWRGTLSLREGQTTGVTATLGDGHEPVRAEPFSGAPGPSPVDREPGSTTAAWLMLGGGAAVALGGVMALQNRKDGAALQDDPTNQQLRDEVDASYRASLGLYVGGGIAAAVGLVWWLLAPGGDDGARVGVAPGSVGLGGAW